MNKKDTIKIVSVLGVMLIIIGIAFTVEYFIKEANKPEEVTPLSLTSVSEYSTFFAITNDVNQYFDYVKDGDSSAILSVLSKDYIKKNGITYKNIFNFILKIEDEVIVQARKLSFQQIQENYLYLLEGHLIKNEFEQNIIVDKNFKIFVIVDYNSNTFAIYPITKSEETKNPLLSEKINIKPNNYNKIITSGIITNDFMCNLYYADFLNIVYSDIIGSYNLLNKELKKNYSQSYYEEYMKENIQHFSSVIKNCNLIIKDDLARVYEIEDDNNNIFVFTENEIMDYEVKLSFKDF